jgi:hypothetical protein
MDSGEQHRLLMLPEEEVWELRELLLSGLLGAGGVGESEVFDRRSWKKYSMWDKEKWSLDLYLTRSNTGRRG